MSSRVTKSKKPAAKRVSQNRHSLQILVEAVGTLAMPCSYCEQRGLVCKISPQSSSRCQSCVRAGESCDGYGLSVAAAQKIAAEKERLEREEEEAEEKLLQLQEKMNAVHLEMNTQFARISRLRRQKRQVTTKGLDMIRRGLESMDALEKAEQDEAAAEEVSHIDGTFRDYSAEVVDASWDSLGLGDYLLPASGVAGESPSEGVAHG
ncbi:hypothetical protein BGZ61DRAFT_499694 [Ilyonectria robusta]|uniref:uncharacterized protein n=1 Tax=Ilyonectria robusta TaxID=1079257 RepID=UPI001E8E9ED6|nr:uncharacterized protein BGZ61DRAFT_499694 [Ilyonectria robusta]KAH8659681.1 hypothetical protein BGZ61DRAFT_499694 [Ilyonectria robusta]